MQKPKFTVVIPLYNKENYIVKSVHSVLEQAYTNFELIVVDDGSTDNSCEKLQYISDSRLRIERKVNGGVSSARNFGIKKAKGEYVAFLDADDEYEPNFLAEINRLLESYPRASAAASAYFIKRGEHKTLPTLSRNLPKQVGIIDDFFSHWLISAFFCASSVVIKRDYFYCHAKWFPEGEAMGEDQDMWFHLAQHGTIAYVAKNLSNYNVGVENSLTKSGILTEELPFVTRLRTTTKGVAEDRSKLLFLQKYDFERAVNNALVGNKKLAFSILLKHGMSFNFLKLRCIILALLFSPTALIDTVRKLKRRLRK